MPINSKTKGKVGERAWVKILIDHGWAAKRTGFHQSQQGHDAPDVTCLDLPVHWEVKNQETSQPRKWMEQSIKDAKPYEVPTVVWKANRKPWLAILRAEDFLTIIQHTDLKALEESLQVK